MQFKISEDDIDKRLDHFLTEKVDEFSRSQIHKMIKTEHICVNGNPVKTGYKLELDDIITFSDVDVETDETPIEPEDIPLDIVYEDDDVIVINKPAELVVHPGAGNYSGTLVNALLHHCGDSLSSAGGNDRLGIVHRLDKGTSGLLVCAKNNKAHRHLAKQFEEKTAVRVYKALCWHPFSEEKGRIETQIGRNKKNRKKQAVLPEGDGKYAATNFIVEKQYPFVSIVRFKLDTGRTHQIRVHCNYIKHPVFADDLYSGDDRQIKSIHLHYQKFAKVLLKYIHRQALHAYRLSFVHPVTNETLNFDIDLPEDMKFIIEKLDHKFLHEELR